MQLKYLMICSFDAYGWHINFGYLLVVFLKYIVHPFFNNIIILPFLKPKFPSNCRMIQEVRLMLHLLDYGWQQCIWKCTLSANNNLSNMFFFLKVRYAIKEKLAHNPKQTTKKPNCTLHPWLCRQICNKSLPTHWQFRRCIQCPQFSRDQCP